MGTIIRRDTVTRQTQQADTLYVLPDDLGFFVSPDGEGRFWFDTLTEVVEQYGSPHGLPIVHLDQIPED